MPQGARVITAISRDGEGPLWEQAFSLSAAREN
jgi:hypothetical protein